MMHRGEDLSGMCQNHLRLKCHQLFCQHLCLSAAGRKASIDADVAALRPTEPIELLPKPCETHLGFRIVLGKTHQHCDAPHARLLRPRRQRPRGCRAADECDERAPPHSITSSARASSDAGMSKPSALAVLRLITSSNLVGACTGRSAGFSPLRMRST